MTNDGKNPSNGSACGCGGGSCCGGQSKWAWIVLALAVVGVLAAKDFLRRDASPAAVPGGVAAAVVTNVPGGELETVARRMPIPRLVDLGAGKCNPCKMMAPILDDLKKTYAGKLDVQFIDVWVNPDEGKRYEINLIPTQIFYDAQGKELFRHEGFFSKEDILAKWKELGVELGAATKGEGAGKDGMVE